VSLTTNAGSMSRGSDFDPWLDHFSESALFKSWNLLQRTLLMPYVVLFFNLFDSLVLFGALTPQHLFRYANMPHQSCSCSC